MVHKAGSSRPLSPHATIYRWPMNAILSISHRITGIGMTVGAFLAVWWFLAASISPEYFAFVDGLLTSVVGEFLLVCVLAALCLHFCTGVRHLIWDIGKGFEANTVRASGIAGIVVSAAMFLLTLAIVAG
ncbi:MAG: succinate dehydrogenase, cytochrome b556 subunit [Albidovulum sp.]|nr:succinate dehydrogenase, cytochrome b556 subunit [Albidovulum sp.]MDE0533939.1 succinate dehydrogenase, cytochrome b556 subunit [Albidovulum sp.]